jgi:Flp pilus assembly protein CpaB
MAVFENKKQLLMIVGAVAIGIVASVMVAGYVKTQITEETNRLAAKYQKDQKIKETQYNEQLAILNHKLDQVETRATQAAEAAARAIAEKQAAIVQAPSGGEAPTPKKSASLALKTPPGKRAVTINIESLGAVGGLINPGDFVDVIAHLDRPIKSEKEGDKDKKETVTAMIFQKLQILAIDANVDKPGAYEEQFKAATLRVTLAVNPQEVSLLVFADKNGKLELALRGPNESKSVMLSAATWSTLAEYVLENNGADIQSSDERKVAEQETAPVSVEVGNVEEVKPYIQIYKGGREL